MAQQITHAFVSTKPDSPDITLINPSNWNAIHIINDPMIIPVENYGAVGDGVTDDTAAIQSSITALAGTGKTLWMSKTYKITSTVSSSVGGITIDGGGTIKPISSANSFVGLSFLGLVGSVNTSVTADVNGNFSGRFLASTMSITVGSTSGITSGTWLQLSYNASGTRFYYQVAQVASVAGNTVTFWTPIYIPMDHTQSSTVTSFIPIIDLHIRNLTFDGSGMTPGVTTPQMLLVGNSCFNALQNLKFQNAPTSSSNNDSAPLYITTGFCNYVNNILAVNAGGHNGDMWFVSQTSLQADHIRSVAINGASADNHGIDVWGCTDCKFGQIHSSGHSGRGMRILGSCNIYVGDATFANNAENGCFITWNSYQIHLGRVFVTNCIGTGNDGVVLGGDNEDYITCDNLVSINNQVSGWNDLTSTTHSRVHNFVNSGGLQDYPTIEHQNTATFQDNLLIGTSVAGAVTLNSSLCTITTESLTTAANNTYSLAVSNDRVLTTNTHVYVSFQNGTNTGGIPVLSSVTPLSKAVNIQITNLGTTPFNGTFIIRLNVLPIG